MKKFIYLIAIFLIGFASCVNNQEEISKDLSSISSIPNTVGEIYKVDASNKTQEMLDYEKKWGVTFTHAAVSTEPEMPIYDLKDETLEDRKICDCQADYFSVQIVNNSAGNYWVYHWNAHYAGLHATNFAGYIEGTGGGAGNDCYLIFYTRTYIVPYTCQSGMSTAPWRVNGNPASPCNYDQIFWYCEMRQQGQDGELYYCTNRNGITTWFTNQSCICE